MKKYSPFISIFVFVLFLVFFVGCDDERPTKYKTTNKKDIVKIIWQEKVYTEAYNSCCYVFQKIEIENKEYILIYNNYNPRNFKVIEVKP